MIAYWCSAYRVVLTLVGLHLVGGALVVGGRRRGRGRVPAGPRPAAALGERRAQLGVAAEER